MRRRIARYLLAALAAMAAVATLQAHGGTALEKEGELLLSANCSRCHATGRTGASTHPEAPPFRKLSDWYPIDGLAEGLSVGHPDMPEFVFEPDRVAAILANLNSIQQR